jgi:sortase A
VRTAVFQREQASKLESLQQAASQSELKPGALIGKLVIPSVGISAIVTEGVDDEILSRAVGHIPGTALPGSQGTIGLAGHRDTFFRTLKGMKQGDRIFLETPAGDYEYKVTRMDIVAPSRVEVLESASRPSLVLVTCYPFDLVGPAPRRFIVTASLDASSASIDKPQT